MKQIHMVGMGLTDHHHIKIAMEENALECPSAQMEWHYNKKMFITTKKIVAIISHSLQ